MHVNMAAGIQPHTSLSVNSKHHNWKGGRKETESIVKNVKHSCYYVLFPICMLLEVKHRKSWFCLSVTNDGVGATKK